MATVVRIEVCMEDRTSDELRPIYDKVWKRLEEIAWRMNVYDDRSDVAKINQAINVPATIGKDTYQLLQQAFAITEKTSGAFDITVWPLIDLWRQSAMIKKWPTSEAIQARQQLTGMSKVQLLANNQVFMALKGVKVDLGGIAKGYAVDEAARILRDQGVVRFFIDAGGDVYGGGYNCLGHPWRIGIKDPRDPSKIMDVVLVQNQSVATSGDYEQYFEINGEQWSHIIDPLSGYPQKGVISASVMAPTSLEADAWATALTVLGAERGTALINAQQGYASLILTQDQDGLMQQVASRQYLLKRQKR